MSDTICVGVIGLGNVGQSVVEILSRNGEHLFERTGKRMVIKTAMVRSLDKKRDVDLGSIRLTTTASDILEDDDIQIVVELMGGEYPAYDYICEALRKGKYVVSANKEVIAKHLGTFVQLAKENGVDLFFEAAVGGGIPLIRTLKVGLAANRIQGISGILNGTTNYMLTKIEQEQKPFDEILKQAQDLGFAEADPSMDISGLDAAYKLVILAGVAFKAVVSIDQISYEGIEGIGLDDIGYASELGYRIKLLAVGKRSDAGLQLCVAPALILKDHPLASIHNEVNAVFVTGDAVGEALLAGNGAGGSPTGSAVVSDMIDILFDLEQSVTRRNLEERFHDVTLIPESEETSGFYFRILAVDESGSFEKISALFSEHSISIANIIQKRSVDGKAEIVIITHESKRKVMLDCLDAIHGLGCVDSVPCFLRVGL